MTKQLESVCTYCGQHEGYHSHDCVRKPRIEMPEEKPSNGFVKLVTPLFSASMGGKDIQFRDIILVLIFVGMCGGGALWWWHTVEAKEFGKEVVAAIKVVSIQQREAACILRFEHAKRDDVYAFCRQIAREPLP